MRRRGRSGGWRWWGKWTGAAATGAILVVLVGSCFTSLYWARSRMTSLRIYSGLVEVLWVSGPDAPLEIWQWPQFVPPPAPQYVLWPPDGRFRYPGRLSTSTGRFPSVLLRFPIWPVLVLTAFPTALLWRRDRKRPGHCPLCAYDLAGNTSGVCPECGAPARVGHERADDARASST